MTNNFIKALKRENDATPPVWMMRQAGRYHSHYQGMKQSHTFEELCKDPKLAAEVAMGPIRDFDFDAAILFSDILFPLEIMGTPLEFAPGPKLGFHLKTLNDLNRYIKADISKLDFQAEALTLTREALPQNKSLIGFVGSPLTLYVFAVHGTHKTDLTDARNGLKDGRFAGFMDRLLPVLTANMISQAKAKPDVMAIFDSCAGDISVDDYKNTYLPYLAKLLTDFKSACPDMPVIYYGQNIGAEYWGLLDVLPITVLGVDHRQNLTSAMNEFSDEFALQGNFDPEYLTLPEDECLTKIQNYFDAIHSLPKDIRKGWIAGLGHGVTPQAKEQNVRNFISELRKRDW
ncbi:MAG: uroporphyrinogen decarboxylase [Micavibrio aeruginosavorus]|uniref:Uroporphyrinogen decarboxylase n=1 Tax=Micavibrio aeruginosavorus TaxID=349221 RepID=A0A2W5HT80_9BACT|nr:MAG: uroporphyrinogen decarboxylase [Micavibrio aeruginosavorus]